MDYLKWSSQDLVGTITLGNAPANALSSKVLKELSGLLDEIEHDDNVRVVLIQGEGRFFSAGADIKEFTTIENGEQFSNLARLGQNLFERIENFPKPIIAAVHGAALGGGLELAMACHFRLVSEKAKFGLPELSLGLIPGFAGSQRLPRLVGTARAAEMLLTSVPISGEEAVKVGLANHAYPESELFKNALNMAKQISKKSPVSLKAILELLSFTKTNEFHAGVEREAVLFGAQFESADGQEGISAFIEKREPNFVGK
ncbi:enoyl-CoA hydratase [Bacillus sp. 1NLA3E]|uniref:enoyl-CoA hydratase n=1 Tax=Bacillus sp. 1NLA3E TaxID=666686 RepID=UPI000247EA14|nr:enoyl-CoA hydratase [Bacillus sp. 1NLA3E]AGK55141.1 enoyl-CoA hydratase [Bacillus sp. 1NLA3E]